MHRLCWQASVEFQASMSEFALNLHVANHKHQRNYRLNHSEKLETLQ